MKIYTYTIPGKPVSQKNSKQIARNRKTGAMFIVSAEKVKTWHKMAKRELLAQHEGREEITGELGASIVSYLGERQRGDVDNLAAAPMDALQKAGVIRSDYQITRLTSERRRDSEDPRVEITLVRSDGK